MGIGIFGPLAGSVVLDTNGYGVLRFGPNAQTWSITNISVIASSNVKEATATVYKTQIGAAYRLSGTYAGSSGDNNTLEQPITLMDGECLWVVWESGDVGATATATISGTATVVDRGFRVH